MGYRFSLHGRAQEAVDGLGMAMANRFASGLKTPTNLEIIMITVQFFLPNDSWLRLSWHEQRFIPPRAGEQWYD